MLHSKSAAILHLRHHRLFGHKFPRRAEQKLMQELREEGEHFIGRFSRKGDRPFVAVLSSAPKPWKNKK